MTTLPAGWVRMGVGDVLTLRYGKALDPALRDPSGPFPVVGSAGRMTGTLEPLIAEPVVLVGRKGNVGAVQLETDGCWPIDTTYYATVPETLDAKFLMYQLVSLEMKKLDSSTATPSLRKQDLAAQVLSVPPLTEQHRIVDLLEDHLSRLDAADALVRASMRREKALRDAALYSWVDQARGSADVELVTLGAISKVASGLTPLKANKAFYDGGTIPWITSGDLHQGLITRATSFVTELALNETTLKMVPAGALLVAMYGEGKTRGTVAELGIDATTNQACAAVVLDDPSLRPWVRLVLDANYTRLRRLAAGGVQPNLNLSIVKSIEIPIPNEVLRADLLAQRSELDHKAARLKKELEAAQRRGANLRRSLLAAAFSGRLTSESSELSAVEGMISA